VSEGGPAQHPRAGPRPGHHFPWGSISSPRYARASSRRISVRCWHDLVVCPLRIVDPVGNRGQVLRCAGWPPSHPSRAGRRWRPLKGSERRRRAGPGRVARSMTDSLGSRLGTIPTDRLTE